MFARSQLQFEKLTKEFLAEIGARMGLTLAAAP
jgi:hypothetical protein